MTCTVRTTRAGLAIALLTASSQAGAADEMPTPAEMWKIIQQQQREIEALKRAQQRNSEKADATAEALEQQATVSTASGGALRNTRIGGYGELTACAFSPRWNWNTPCPVTARTAKWNSNRRMWNTT